LKGFDNNSSYDYGEVNIIVLDDDCIVFLEVKISSSNDIGSLEESIIPGKVQN